MSGATLPSTWNSNHYPTAAEFKQLLDAVQAMSNVSNYWANSPAGPDVTVTSYADISPAQVTFVKTSASSQILVRVQINCYITTGAPFETLFGVSINGTDYDIAKMSWTAAGTLVSLAIVGERMVTSSLAAGSYTIKLRGKNGTAAKTAKIDSTTLMSLTCQEVWP